MFVNRRSVTIEWGDCDPAGIVFYPRYFAMFDASTAHLFAAALGYDKFALRQRFGIVGFPMVDTSAKFIMPSRYGETVTIESAISRFGRSSFGITHRLLRGARSGDRGFRDARLGGRGSGRSRPHPRRAHPGRGD